MEGGATGPDDDVVAESLENIGATVMGRHMFGGGDGPLGRRALERVVGRRSPLPHAGLRDHPPPARAARDAGRDDLPLRHRRHRGRARAGHGRGRRAGTSRWAAAPTSRGSTSAAGLIDEMEIHVVPLLLGGGARLFDDLEGRYGRARARARHRLAVGHPLPVPPLRLTVCETRTAGSEGAPAKTAGRMQRRRLQRSAPAALVAVAVASVLIHAASGPAEAARPSPRAEAGVLMVGSHGPAVRALQRELRRRGLRVRVDGGSAPGPGARWPGSSGAPGCG